MPYARAEPPPEARSDESFASRRTPLVAVGSSARLGVIGRPLRVCRLELLLRLSCSVANQPSDRRPSSNRSFSLKIGSNGSGAGDALTK